MTSMFTSQNDVNVQRTWPSRTFSLASVCVLLSPEL